MVLAVELITEASVEDSPADAAARWGAGGEPRKRCGSAAPAAPGVTVINDGTDRLRAPESLAEQIGTAAWRAWLPVYELTARPCFARGGLHAVTQDSIETTPERHDERCHGNKADVRTGGVRPGDRSGPVIQVRVILRAEWTKPARRCARPGGAR